MKRKKIKIDPYNCNLHLCVGKSMKKLCKKISKQIDHDLSDYHSCEGLTIGGDQEIYVLLERKKDLIEEDAVLVHELSHVVMDTFKGVGVFLDPNNQEPFAYLIGDLYRKCKKFKDGK